MAKDTKMPAWLKTLYIVGVVVITGLFGMGLAGLMMEWWVVSAGCYVGGLLIVFAFIGLNKYKKLEDHFGKKPIKTRGTILAIVLSDDGRNYRLHIQLDEQQIQTVAYTSKPTFKTGDQITVLWSKENEKVCRVARKQ